MPLLAKTLPILQNSTSGPWTGCAVEPKRARNLPDPRYLLLPQRVEEGATTVSLSNSPSRVMRFLQRSLPRGRGERVPGLTYAPYVNGHIHVAVLCAVVHGLLQGFQLGLAVAAGTEWSCCRVRQVRPLGQDLLQWQNITLLLLWLSKQLTKDIPVSHSTTERGRGKEGGRAESVAWLSSGYFLRLLAAMWQVRTSTQEIKLINCRTGWEQSRGKHHF